MKNSLFCARYVVVRSTEWAHTQDIRRMRGAPLPLKAINEDSNSVAIRDGTGSKML